MRGIVDRFEGEYVVIEVEGETEDIRREFVDSDVKVNDVVVLVDGIWMVDKDETEKRSREIRKLMDDVWED